MSAYYTYYGDTNCLKSENHWKLKILANIKQNIPFYITNVA